MTKEFPNGVYPVMLTPFTENNEVDYEALGKLIDWYIEKGVNGLFADCQSSEMFFLSLEERVKIGEFVKKHADGRVPVVTSGHISDSLEDQAKELIHACAEKNIGFIAMKPLAGGAIEDAVTALRYVCANPDVTVVIPGMADIAELNQNLAAVNDSSPLSVEEEAKMRAIRDALGTQFCRRCNYCQPCSAGISISSVFLFEGYLTRYGLADWARSRYATLTKKASDCIGCGACESRCPYHLPIRSMLKEAAEKFGE